MSSEVSLPPVEAIKDTSFVLNEKQMEAAREMRRWYLEGHKPYFVLGGYAGTGKTSTVKCVLDTLNVKPALCAYTAKAANVLHKKTPPHEAMTIHRLVYNYRSSPILDRLKKELAAFRKQPQSSERDTAISNIIDEINEVSAKLKAREFKKKTEAEFIEHQNYEIIVADECSMIGQKIFDDLLSFGVKVLFVGDPGQLDPIRETKTEKTLHELAPVEFLLTEIVRHDNAIVDMADMARNQKHIPFTNRIKDGFGKLHKADIGDFALSSADQVICFKHRTRRDLNQRIRRIKGFTSRYPIAGEKLVCRLNNHLYGLARGVTYTLLEDAEPTKGDRLLLNLEGVDLPIKTHKAMFDAYCDLALAEDVDKNRVAFRKEYPPFDFGYALTVHSAQGSEWERVLVWDDFNQRDYQPADYSKWLYTAITRASKACVVAQ